MHIIRYIPVLIWPLAMASPVLEVSNRPKDGSRPTLDQRQSSNDHGFQGIDWTSVFNDSICDDTQRQTLLKTVTNVYDTFAVGPMGANRSTSPAWQRYFGGRVTNGGPQPKYSWFNEGSTQSPDESAWQTEVDAVYKHIQSAFIAAREYPEQGNSVARKRNRQVLFLCQKGERIPGYCKRERVTAYATVLDSGSWPIGGGMPWTITFCDQFFGLRHIEDIISDGPTKAMLERPRPDLTGLYSREHAMYHEYMHVDWFGYSKHIEDMNDTRSVYGTDFQTIYGAYHSSAYARKFYTFNSSVNPFVGINADNYAWYATNLQIRDAWGEEKDPFNYLDEDEYPQLPNPRRRSTTPIKRADTEFEPDLSTWPRNCIWSIDKDEGNGSAGEHCETILDDYNEWVAEELRTTLSPECQQLDLKEPYVDLHAVHPDCKCTDNDTGKERRLYDLDRCRGFVGLLIGCVEADREGCACYTNMNDGPHMVNKEEYGVEDCKDLSRGLTDQDVQDLIDSES